MWQVGIRWIATHAEGGTLKEASGTRRTAAACMCGRRRALRLGRRGCRERQLTSLQLMCVGAVDVCGCRQHGGGVLEWPQAADWKYGMQDKCADQALAAELAGVSSTLAPLLSPFARWGTTSRCRMLLVAAETRVCGRCRSACMRALRMHGAAAASVKAPVRVAAVRVQELLTLTVREGHLVVGVVLIRGRVRLAEVLALDGGLSEIGLVLPWFVANVACRWHERVWERMAGHRMRVGDGREGAGGHRRAREGMIARRGGQWV